MKVREWLPDAVRIVIALLIFFVFLFQVVTWFTGNWKSGLLWGFLLFVTSGVCVIVLSRLFYSLPFDAWMEIVKTVLIFIGFITVLYWVFTTPRPYCKDMDRIRIEVESLDEAVRLFSDGKTNWKDAVSETELRMEDLRRLVEDCQCHD